MNPSATTIPTWFDTPERRSLLLAAAHAWEGTPFFANSEAPGAGGGVDCIHLLRGIFVALGVVEPLAIPHQTMDHGQHSDRSLLIEAFETWPQLTARFVRLPDCSPANLLAGDVLCFLNGRAAHHGGVYLGNDWFLHALKPDGVHRMQLGAKVRGWRIIGQLAAIYRPLPEDVSP